MTTVPKTTINDFVLSVKSQRTAGNYFTSGLIIRKKGTDSSTVQDIKDMLPHHIFFEATDHTNNESVTSSIRNAFEGKKWLFIYLSDGSLPVLLREQLARLKDSNAIFIQGKTQEDTFFADQTDETRIVVFIDEDNIEKINEEGFLNLFGAVIEI